MNEELTRSELAVLEAIHKRGQATRADIGAVVGLGPAMAARLVARLQDAGMVRGAGRAIVAGPGRQAVLVEIHPDAAYVGGLDIGTDVIHCLITDAQGTPRAYREAPSSLLDGQSQREIISSLATILQEVAAEAGLTLDRLTAVGVAITGVIDREGGICLLRSNTPGWENFAVGPQLAARLHMPVVLEETARANGVAELQRGQAHGQRHFLYVDAGMAIGAAIMIDGQPLRAIHGMAGELGHMIVDPGGPLCRCGNYGCLQASASARALVARAHDLLQRGVFSTLSRNREPLALRAIAAAAEGGDKLAYNLLMQAGEHLGTAISMALNILGLDLVVMGGRLAQCSPIVLEAVVRMVRQRALAIVPWERRIVCSTLGSDAAALGAVLQALDHIFAVEPAASVTEASGFRTWGAEQALGRVSFS